MIEFSRRSLVMAGLAATVPPLRAGTPAESTPASKEGRREFLQKANEQWAHEAVVEEAKAKEAERRGEFSSLAPPQQLVPFKDWDYYTKGRSLLWSPNPGQPYKSVRVPTGFVTDLASIPSWAWSSGIRPEGPYAYAAIVHDYLYWMQERPKEEADSILLLAMEDSTVDQALRNRMYNAVSLAGGAAWKKNAQLKKDGEKRHLRKFPSDFTISWSTPKMQPGVFWD